jgi:putative oxidoreductase
MLARENRDDRSGIESARLLLRVALGGTLIAHGLRQGRTLEGTARWFESIGFREAKMQAQVSSVVEVASGSALVAGAGTALAASGVVGTMAVAAHVVHRPNGFFITDEGWEYVGVITAAAIALSALGSGRFSVDRLLGLDRIGSGFGRAALTAGLGVAGAAAHLARYWERPADTE